jgi:galacturonosyltransferase
VQELCEAIERFLSMDNTTRRAMGEAGREYVKANFSRQLVIDAYLKQIKAILAKG